MPPQRAIYLHEIPGHRESLTRAKSSEFRTREDTWLALPQTVAGRKVRVLTVRDYVALLRLQNPFVARREPAFEDLAVFLWLLSPEIEKWHNATGWRKRWLVGCRWNLFSIEAWQIHFAARKLRKELKIRELEIAALEWQAQNQTAEPYDIPENCPLAMAFKAAFEYMDKMFLDRPAGLAREGTGAGLLYLTSWFDALQSEYHFTDEAVWKMPLPVLFGRLKAIQQRLNPGEPEFNARQDALNASIQKQMQKNNLTPADLLAGKINLN